MSTPSPDKVFVVRMSLMFRVQHMLLIFTLLVLAVTGFALMYHENWLGNLLIRLERALPGFLHRAAAVFLMAQMVFHAFYMLISGEGSGSSGGHALQAGPRRFSSGDPVQPGNRHGVPQVREVRVQGKIQYWATAGIFLISITGVSLWAETFSMKFLPKFFLDMALIVHGYQGLLAS